MRSRIAISWARRILVIVSGHHDPALTVASLATTTTVRPDTTPTPVMTPADGASPSVAIIGHQQSDFQPRRPWIEQPGDALAW